VIGRRVAEITRRINLVRRLELAEKRHEEGDVLAQAEFFRLARRYLDNGWKTPPSRGL
jgi:hypothetical protein